MNKIRGQRVIPPTERIIGLCVCYTCDNPRCVNPGHLWLGTKKDNADDRDRKGRNTPPPRAIGENGARAKLTNADVDAIRSSPLSSGQIAPLYGVCDSHIRSLRRGNHFPTPPAQPPEAP